MSERCGATGFFQVAGTREILEAFSWVAPRAPERVPLLDALGRALARDAVAAIDVPHFTRAAMDGYAVAAADTFGASESQPAYLTLRGAVAMGTAPGERVNAGEALRIATGGMLPHGADAVVMWERTRESDDLLEVYRPVAPGEHVVTVGEDVREGERVLAAGRVLRPADVGLLAGLGQIELDVVRRPRVAVVSTGDELVGPEQTPGPGQIRNVNQFSLGAWVRRCGGEPLLLGRVPDDAERILERVRHGLAAADLVLISGGSSAGARDLTRAVVETLGEPGLLYHGIAVRPGKPTVVGAHRGVPVFGLPGHPISAMVIFLVLVRPLLERMLGVPAGESGINVLARLADNLPSQAGREDYYQVTLRAAAGGMEAVPVFRKSGLVTAMVRGRGMVRVPAEREGLEAGELVEVEILA
ncbi:MAG TPA: gephyrin-like molybdotransferase Glp [Candidatus Methanoperedens sp.]|nr:gephyrin-like molybdotransferase Glp [Candidatus Methanoperedens sp.]